jgi:hypothetical protein
VPYLDDATMQAIESDLAAAHQSLAHGDLDMKNATKTGIKILETVVPAAAFSYMNARAAGGELKIGPVPVDLGVGIGLALLSMFDIAGGYEDDLLNLGIGALASYGARTGAAFGAASVTPAAAPAAQASGLPQDSGMLSISGAMPAHGAHNAPMQAARLRRMHHHVSGQEISGAVPPGTERFVVQRVA